MPLDQAAMFIGRSQLSCGAALGIDPETARRQSEKHTTGPSGQLCHFTRWPLAGGCGPTPSWRAARPCEWLLGVVRNHLQCVWGLDAAQRNQLRRFAPADAWAAPGIEPGPEGAAPNHPGAQLNHVSGSGEWRGTARSVCGGLDAVHRNQLRRFAPADAWGAN